MVVIGAGRVGRAIVSAVPEHHQLTIIDVNEEQLASFEGSERPISTISGDGTSRLTLDKVAFNPSSVAVLATDSDAVNLEAARMIKAHFPHEQVVCLLNASPEDAHTLEPAELCGAPANGTGCVVRPPRLYGTWPRS